MGKFYCPKGTHIFFAPGKWYHGSEVLDIVYSFTSDSLYDVPKKRLSDWLYGWNKGCYFGSFPSPHADGANIVWEPEFVSGKNTGNIRLAWYLWHDWCSPYSNSDSRPAYTNFNSGYSGTIGTYKVPFKIRFSIVLEPKVQFWTWIDGFPYLMKEFDFPIDGRWIHSPWFGGQEAAPCWLSLSAGWEKQKKTIDPNTMNPGGKIAPKTIEVAGIGKLKNSITRSISGVDEWPPLKPPSSAR